MNPMMPLRSSISTTTKSKINVLKSEDQNFHQIDVSTFKITQRLVSFSFVGFLSPSAIKSYFYKVY